MTLDRPIILIGTGRCGSSFLYRVLSEHPDAGWTSRLCNLHPGRPVLNRALLDAQRSPGVGTRLCRRYQPVECWDYWEHYAEGFTFACRDLTAADVTVRTRRQLREAFARVTTPRHPRLLTKITGWPRLGFLHEVFPEARFVHLYRDGRAVANSLLKEEWWWGWRGPENWRWGPLSPEDAARWAAHERSFVVLAGLHWRILMEATRRAAAKLPEGVYMEVAYEDFCEQPEAALADILAFCDLPDTPVFRQRRQRHSVRGANHKWREDLTPSQQDALDAALADDLPLYGYEEVAAHG